MKKILLTSFAVLSVIGVQKVSAETTLINNGVTYSATQVGEVVTGKEIVDTTYTLNLNNVTEGLVEINYEISGTRTDTTYYNANPTSVADNYSNISISDFEIIATGNIEKSNEAAYRVEYLPSIYTTLMNQAHNIDSKIVTFDALEAESNLLGIYYYKLEADFLTGVETYTRKVTTSIDALKADFNWWEGSYYYHYTFNDASSPHNGKEIYVALYRITKNVTKNIVPSSLKKCTVNEIKSSFVSGNTDVTSITIGKNVATIVDRAFCNAPNLQLFTVQSGNTHFTYENGILYNTAKTEIYAATSTVQSQYIPETVETVRSGAFNNTANYIAISTLNSNLDVVDDQEYTKVTFLIPSSSLESIEDANGGIIVIGNVTQANLDACIQQQTNVTFWDFTFADILENLTIDNQTNTLFFFETTFEVTGNNVVNNGVCEKLVIKDSERTKRFHSPISFTAKEATYDREFDNCWSTMCLPFNVKNTTINGNLLCGELKAYNDSHGLFTFLYSTSINANTPYIVKTVNEGQKYTIEAYGVTVEETTENNSARVGHATFNCIFKPNTFESDGTTTYFGIKKGTGNNGNPNSYMMRLEGATVNAFRCYLTAPTSESFSQESAQIRLVDAMDNEIETIELPFTTDINNVEKEAITENIYNINGQKQNEVKRGLNIVNGKVIINK